MTSSPRSDRLTILHVSEVSAGGVLSLLRHFTSDQCRHGHAVHLLAPDDTPDLAPARMHRWRLHRSRPWSLVTALCDLRSAVRTVAPDVIHVHSFVAGLVVRLPGVRRSWHRDVPVVYQPHAWSFELFATRAIGSAVRRWEAWASRRTDILVANCQDEIDEGRSVGVGTPARVLGVAVAVDRFRPVSGAERAALRRALAIDAARVAICVGRLTRQKGQDLLLASWEEQRPEGCVLYLVGGGDAQPLQRIARSQWGVTVHAVGESPDVEAWLAAADVMVLPSRYETVGVAVAEALSSGIPVVATAFNGAHDTIDRGPLPAAGAVVPIGDMAAMICELGRRLDDPALHRAESRAGRQRAEAMFDPAGVADRLEGAYHEAIRLHQDPKAHS